MYRFNIYNIDVQIYKAKDVEIRDIINVKWQLILHFSELWAK